MFKSLVRSQSPHLSPRDFAMALPPVLSETLRIPVIGSPLFIISNPDLVIAQCKAGIVGLSCPECAPGTGVG